MSKKSNMKYKYAVIQYRSKEKCKDTDYIVICSQWITTKTEGKFFFWPGKNWLSNKQAVKNCEKVECGTWLLAPIKTIVHYSNDFYDAVLYTITLRHFNINAFKINDLKKVHDQVYEYIDCPGCSKWLHEFTASLTHEDAIDSKLVTKSPTWSPPKFPSAVIKIPQNSHSDCRQSDLFSDRLFTKNNIPSSASNKSSEDSMSPSLLDSYIKTRRNVQKRPHPSSPLSIKQLSPDKQSNFDCNVSPTSLYSNEKSAKSTDNTMSPSMLDLFYSKRRNCPKTINVCIRLENKFDETQYIAVIVLETLLTYANSYKYYESILRFHGYLTNTYQRY